MKIAIIGAGVMGSGITLSSILAGYETILFDVHPASLEKGKSYIIQELNKSVVKNRISQQVADEALKKLILAENRDAIVADLILEAVVENLQVKKDLFAALEAQNGINCILASNTSSIPITQIANGLKHPERVVGIHFFNPAHIMKLVEIISGAATTVEIAEKAFQWAISLGKKAVMAKDSPGFIVNRVARPYYTEGLKIAEEQVCDFSAIDALCEASGFKMGPFRLMDLIGVETNFAVTSSMYAQFHFEPRFRPNRLQQQKVDAGYFGQKNGKGFYHYDS